MGLLYVYLLRYGVVEFGRLRVGKANTDTPLTRRKEQQVPHMS